ncbi:restriction endonuclease subunit S [Xylanibacter rodentium]|uniref:restriction endonuclease subunit S n=1 Tax=Xylanibacter rodentium TaxID=2736289 RepID=UPI00258E3772|nr:restriction endonuclease subunit S [Xylanibacter rodentium]
MKHNWEYKRLGDVCKLCVGGDKPADISEIQNSDNSIPVFSNGIENEGLYGYCKKSTIQEPSVTISGRGTLGVPFIRRNPFVPIVRLVVATPDYSLRLEYLYYWLLFRKFSGNGAAIPQLTVPMIRNEVIPVPPIEVQERIVAELDKINDVVEDCRELLRNLDALAQSLFYDTFGDPVSNPKGWEMKKLSDECLDIVDGDHSTPPKTDNGIPFITISNIDKNRNTIDFSDTFFVSQSYYDELKDNRKVRKGDVLYTVTGSYGATVLIDNQPKFCFQRHIGLIRPKATLNSVFLSFWGRSAAIKSFADTVATGIAQRTVSLTSLRNFPLILPPLSLQQQFAERIEAIEAQKANVEATLAEMQMLLDSRMDYWFND